ncbi:NAD(+)--dinitrogen-reductase ADP-D-ribosyltransferase [Rhodocyclus gracilis]|uniref:NAD(+) ADP-ribosyltransferase n=1 Tax=Rhodocyclus tenuis TaxID=1066 RepID=A0A6L5JYF1_RHOTE|nr:NAD(+)--dinitrogen-reductase ADP-D-ribosyltransferase [Rhodocyclus gracilis]MQY52357.1 NAD(+) ADP-ribosyltransferase [Rhodocyclus gracilis]
MSADAPATTEAELPDEDNPERWYSTNFVGVPTRLLASTAFNAHPRHLSIHGTREAHRGLFRLLDSCPSQAAAADVFEHYMAMVFGLDGAQGAPSNGPFRFATSYIDLLRAWGFDSNSAPGAVLKGWIESRFGLTPVYHRGVLGRFPSPVWVDYIEEKMGSRFHNNCINLQLDLLYEYCQWSIRHFRAPGPIFVRLWRGTNHCQEQLIAGRARDAHCAPCVMRLNNLVSFSRSPERAEEFGDWMIEADVPAVKLLFFPGLLSQHVLNSECEYLVIGGSYRVKARYGYR